MNPLISILLPTKNREAKLLRCLREIKEKTDYDPYEIVVEVEPNGQKYEFLNDMPEIITLRPEKNLLMAPALILLAEAARGDYVVYWNDDMFPEPGWLTFAMEEMQGKLDGYGLVGFSHNNDKDDNGIITGLISKQMFLEFTRSQVEDTYYHYYLDTELTQRARATGRCFKSTRARISHEFRKEIDATYTDSDQYWEHDKAVFIRRMTEFGLCLKEFGLCQK